MGPSHLAPYVAPGDSCAPVCGDGLVVGGEASLSYFLKATTCVYH